jgi:uncharacterized protein YjbI with pentapeptide repeats
MDISRAQVRIWRDDAAVLMTEAMTEKDLVVRWRTKEGEGLAKEVLGRLLAGKSLDDLQLGEHDGRVDLRGIAAPASERLGAFERKGWVVQELGRPLKFERVQLVNLDFSGGRLESFRFFNTTISHCRFDEARCQDWRLWAVDVTDTSFVGADLRKAVLGAWYEGRGDVYQRVNFSHANLRSIVCPAAAFIDCDFGDAQLAKVDFQSSGFVRCRFAGMLREVMFHDHGYKTGKPDPNPMEDVDFSEAELRMVEFRHLNLDRVKFPNSSDHMVVHHYRCALERAVRDLESDTAHRGLRTVLEHELKWAGSHQKVGVFNRRDFVEMFEEDGADFAVALLRRRETDCATSLS